MVVRWTHLTNVRNFRGGTMPRLLDLFCGPGGASVGYHRAGFEVVGVDIEPQSEYPYEFHRGDALDYLAGHAGEFDAVHASPPCTEHTTLVKGKTWDRPDNATGTRDLLPRTLAAFAGLGHGYWVVENVMGAAMPTDIILCGAMFGLRVYRHRRFSIGHGAFMLAVPPHPRHKQRSDHRQRQMLWDAGGFMDVTGHDAERPNGIHMDKFREAMGIDWITERLNLAIPPAYTEFIGTQLLEAM